MKYTCIVFAIVISMMSAQAAIFTVSNNNNAGAGSLREAILSANTNGSIDKDFIYFNINANSATDITINLTEELPALTSNITIDASTQPTSFLNNSYIRIKLLRASTDFFNGIYLKGVSDIEIYGIYFSNFLSQEGVPSDERKAGIYLRDTERIVIGKPNKSNGFGNNYTAIISPTSRNFQKEITISSNIIGLDPTGKTAMPNVVGVDLSYMSNSVIGGPSEEYGNIISSNINGLSLGGLSGNINISFNVIGLDITKTKSFIANQSVGIFANGESVNLIINDNFIASQYTGIRLTNIKNSYKIKHNYIGVGMGSTSFGNKKYGVEIYSCGSGVVGGADISDQNIIAYNEQAIQIEFSYPVSILKNSIFCNSKAAIEFKDLPDGKYITQSKINVISANFASGIYLPNSIVELFMDDECPDCQGKIWVASIATNNDGSWQYNGSINGGLTSTGTNPDGATSGFSKPMISELNLQKVDTYCSSSKGSITNLEVSDASIFEWYNSNNEIVGRTKDLINVPAGVYYLKAGQPGGCQIISASYEIKNTDINFKVKNFDSTPASCDLNNGSILIKSYETSAPTLFKWTNEFGIVVSETEKLVGVASGNYTLTASNGQGCSNIVGIFNVGIVAKPIIDISQMQSFISCDGKFISVQNISVVGESGPYNYQWKDENNQVIYNKLLIQGITPGKYSLFIKDKYGCEINSETIDFTRLKNEVLKVSNSFSPNGDGVNDTWKIAGAENYPKAEFSIFNRNGIKVFFSLGYQYEFDGAYKNKALPSGVYYYLIDLKNNCGILSGSLTIIR